MDSAAFRSVAVIVLLVVVVIGAWYWYSRWEGFEVGFMPAGAASKVLITPASYAETPAGGILDGDYTLSNISTDKEDVGVEAEIWGPLYPLPERPPYATLSGLPYNFEPLKEDTVFSNR